MIGACKVLSIALCFITNRRRMMPTNLQEKFWTVRHKDDTVRVLQGQNEHESHISRIAHIVICLQLILMVDASYEWPVCDQGSREVASLLQLVGVTHQLHHTAQVEFVCNSG